MVPVVEENPYQAPAVQEIEAPPAMDAEGIRQQHLRHEASLKGFGVLCYVGAAFNCYAVAMNYYVAWYSGAQRPVAGDHMVWLGITIAIIVLQFSAGYGLRRLVPWSRIPAAILSAVSVTRLPIGPLFGAYGLYLVFSAKGRMVLSPAYREIVAQTPHLRYRTSSAVKILLVVVLIILAGIIAMAIFA